jgi:hypothetical protein
MKDLPYLVLTEEQPVSYNKILRMHWKARNEEAQRAKLLVRYALPAETVLFTGLVDLALIAYYSKQSLVKDNCNLPVKFFIDGLIGRAIADDSPEYVRSVLELSRFDERSPRLEIYIKPAGKEISWNL